MKSKIIPVIVLVSLFIFSTLHAEDSKISFPRGDGKIVFYNYHTGDVLDITYRKENKYDEKALKEIERFFRSRSDKKENGTDILLIELLDNIQDHFEADVIELISGYRSPELNRQLKKRGANVAEESMHLEGKAADIHLDEAAEEAVAEYARGLAAGGVGFYPALDFVHVDTGEVRKWSLPDYPGRLLIAFAKGSEWQIMTDKNIYLPKETISFEVMNITRADKTYNGELDLQKFKRGKWETVSKINSCDGKKLASGKTCKGEIKETILGKFRLVIPKEGFPHLNSLSNEFYRKKI